MAKIYMIFWLYTKSAEMYRSQINRVEESGIVFCGKTCKVLKGNISEERVMQKFE